MRIFTRKPDKHTISGSYQYDPHPVLRLIRFSSDILSKSWKPIFIIILVLNPKIIITVLKVFTPKFNVNPFTNPDKTKIKDWDKDGDGVFSPGDDIKKWFDWVFMR